MLQNRRTVLIIIISQYTQYADPCLLYQVHRAACNSDRCPRMCLQDAVAVWRAVVGEEKPPTVLVGHSLGGAIATWATSRQVSHREISRKAWSDDVQCLVHRYLSRWRAEHEITSFAFTPCLSR